MKLDGKVALITGAASGIGHGIAKRYVEAGGKVVIADLNADSAAKAANELGDTKTAIGIAMDVTARSGKDSMSTFAMWASFAFSRE
jgi:3-hydroxybutyrate dehydrogenase